jgi:hypothetical protein
MRPPCTLGDVAALEGHVAIELKAARSACAIGSDEGLTNTILTEAQLRWI